jgi:protein-S-isoprenylcysteine O-methyltransferase Ste14
MDNDQPFRIALVVLMASVFPVIAYYRIRSQATGEPLDRRREGAFVLFTLRPLGLASMAGLFAFLISPSWMRWSALPLPEALRWVGVGIGGVAGLLLMWTLRTLGPNLTDTVVTRREHVLVTSGPYRWVRHPFYDAVGLAILGNSIAAANWFLMVTGGLALALLVHRTRIEEGHLIARFGDAYWAYAKAAGRFLPRRRGPRA